MNYSLKKHSMEYHRNINPARALAIAKETTKRLYNTRCQSARRERNPILEGDTVPPVRQPKAIVPDYLTEHRKQSDRPRGIGKSVYSYQLHGTLNICSDLPLEYRPSKCMATPFSNRASHENAQVPRKRPGRPDTPGKNPILQLDSSYDHQLTYTRKIGYSQPATGREASPVHPAKQSN